MEISQNRWFISWKNPIKIDDAKGVPHFRKPPYVHHLNHLGVFFHIACTSLQAKGREKEEGEGRLGGIFWRRDSSCNLGQPWVGSLPFGELT